MSQHPATQRRSTRRPAQILQHTAVVFAGMASIGLTVAAGTYIVNQIAESDRHPAAGPAPEAAAPEQAPEPGLRESPGGATTSSLVGLVAESRPLPVALFAPRAPEAVRLLDRTVVPTAPAAAPAERPGMGGRLRLPGDTYVGANVATAQPDSLSMTVDTNVFTTLADRLGDRARGGTTGVTQLRTDFDTKSGEVSFAVSDPRLGRHGMQWQRHAEPAPAIAPEGHASTAHPEAASDGHAGTAHPEAAPDGHAGTVRPEAAPAAPEFTEIPVAQSDSPDTA
ncbi:hypothetical protein [Nocardia blacklockiae]|uniref:hypothetical protein n=1 Tax=Nocardia blacklockiae TaxID=480036 RepID=UPI00189348A6|nr:hypothetical protein [Nocardia blacklockiae]MBF6176460.1 hypothetical protein [Nocardia blacklockiae]